MIRMAFPLAAVFAIVAAACGEVESGTPNDQNDASTAPSSTTKHDAASERADATSSSNATDPDASGADGAFSDAYEPASYTCQPNPCPAGHYCEITDLGGVGMSAACISFADAGACTNEPTCATCFPQCPAPGGALVDCACTETGGQITVFRTIGLGPPGDP
jgi:hypothetical protein